MCETCDENARRAEVEAKMEFQKTCDHCFIKGVCKYCDKAKPVAEGESQK